MPERFGALRASRVLAVPLEVLLPGVLGGAFLVFSLYGDIVRGNPLVATVMSAAICGAAALSGWRLRASAIVSVVLLVAAVPLPAAQVGIATNACIVLFLAAGLRAKRRVGLVLAAFLLPPLLVRPAILSHLTVSQIVLTGLVWLTLFGLAWGFGFTVHSLQRLAEYRAAEAVAAERRQWAIELHDTLKHDLVRMRMLTQSLTAKGSEEREVVLLDEQVQLASRHLSGLLGVLAENTAASVARASLTRAESETTGPSVASSLRAERGRLERAGFSVHATLDEGVVPVKASALLARVGREATNNIVRHGDPAGPVTMLLEVADDRARLVLVNASAGHEGPRSGVGLATMRDQVVAAGGTFRGEERDGCWMTDVVVPWGRA